MNKNQNDNRAPQKSLASNWAGNKAPIYQGCYHRKRGESAFLSRDPNFARTMGGTVKKVSPIIQAAKDAARKRKEAAQKAGQRYKLTAKGYRNQGGVYVKGFHKVAEIWECGFRRFPDNNLHCSILTIKRKENMK